jgi:hypothetical protein
MNFINGLVGQEIQLELKYCERCGGLWLRRQGNVGVYCGCCETRLAAMPDPGVPPRGPRRRRRKVPAITVETRGGGLQSPISINYLHAVANVEMWA